MTDRVANPLTLILTMKSPEACKAIQDLVSGVQALPVAENPVWQALDKLAIVHFARFTFIDEGTKLAVITVYDGDLENYLNEFIDAIGDVFNALLEQMVDAPPLPIQEHREEFHAFVRKYDLTCEEPFYSAYPTLTVLDIQALRDA